MATKPKHKSKPRSRTAKTKITKKSSFPRWALFVVVLVIAGVSGFLIYRSYATSVPPILQAATYTKTRVHCSQGACRADSFTRNEVASRPHTVFTQRVPTATCVSGIKYREEKFVNARPDLPFGQTALGKFDEDNGGKRRSGVLRSDVCLEPPFGLII